MAERMMLVCDTCGKPAAETVTFKTSRGNRQRDYCTLHLDELLSASRAPKRGRRPGTTGASAGQTKTTKKSTAKRTAKKPTAKRTAKKSRAKRTAKKPAAIRKRRGSKR